MLNKFGTVVTICVGYVKLFHIVTHDWMPHTHTHTHTTLTISESHCIAMDTTIGYI